MDWEVRDHGNPAQWLSILDRHGVDRAVFMGHANLVRPDLCEQDNNNLARMAAAHSLRLIPVGTSWPQLREHSVAEARRCLEQLGMKGLKFHPWSQGFSTADPLLGEMCGVAGDAGVPVWFHDGTPCYSLSEQIAGLARRFPRTRFVLAHAGLLWNWRSALFAARLPNVWLFMCGPHLRAMELLCAQADRDRIVWGSDFGFGLADQIEYRLNLFLRIRIPQSVRDQILGVNPLRLLNVEA
jgi:predicted TIM-barrel fold metal-dependent hydrolase